MIAEIIATGEEIRSGALVDSNSAYIAAKLQENGIAVTRHTSVGDDLDLLAAAFKEIGSRADIAVVTGGLGPTSDDLTSEAAAKAAGAKLVLNRSALQSVEDFFKARKRKMNAASQKQAWLPDGAKCLPNPVGTAPGFHFKIGKCLFFFLPGVPQEMRRLLSDKVLPKLKSRFGSNRHSYSVRTFSVFGLTESQAFERLAGLEKTYSHISLGLQVKFPEIRVKLYARGHDVRLMHEELEAASQRVTEKMGHNVFSANGNPMEETVGRLLMKNNATLALAESCTGGLIANMLTDVSGSSEYFMFSAVTYSNQAKIDFLNVSENTLQIHGAVHEETAREMAFGTRQLAGTTYGLATSGIAGPSGGTQEKPVGTVCIGLATPHGSIGHRFHFWFGSRSMHKQVFAVAALDVLRRELLGIDPPKF